MRNFIFYDTETTGVKELDFLQVIQFAAIQTDESLNEKRTFEQLCSPLPWTLVSPKAVLVNKKSEIFSSEINHYELITNVYKFWKEATSQEPGLFITYNGMRFDEEVMRRQFYWNLYDPYVTNTNGNNRLDLFIKMYVVAHFYKKVFPIPVDGDKISLKLEDIARTLNLDVSNAHDALADCIFLKELMRNISTILPNFYKEILNTTSKEKLLESLKNNLIHFNCYYVPSSQTTRTYPFTALISNYSLNKYIPIFDLRLEPNEYLELSYSELESIINNPKETPFKRLATNKSLPTISLKTLHQDNIEISDLVLYEKRASIIHKNESFKEKVIDIFNNLEFVSNVKSNIEEQIYSQGFPSSIEKDRFQNFHKASTYEEKSRIIESFDDERFKEFGYRICAQEFVDEIETEKLLQLKNLVHQRFNEEGPWPNAKSNLEEGRQLLLESTSDDEKELLKIAINFIEKSL